MNKSEAQVRAAIREKAREAGSLSDLAHQTGINRSQLSCFVNGRKPITDSMLKRLGWKRIVAFQKLAP